MEKDRILDVRNLKTNFLTGGGVVQAVRGISFYINKGEKIGIVGESGCGKSVSMLSVLKLLGDNAQVQADLIEFNGVNILEKDSKDMRSIQGNEIGMIFQDPMTSLNPLFTIGNQLMETLKIHKNMSKEERKAKAINLLELVGIPSPESRLKQYPHEFSGGMRQRAMIAMAMSCDPKLLIADEPTTALDVTIQAQILELMEELNKKFNTSTILITHDLGVISSFCSRVIVMYGGLIMEEAPIEELFYNPSHPYTKGLLKSVPKVTGDVREKLVPIVGSPPDLMNPPKGCPFAGRCDYAMKICKEHLPELSPVNENHSSACWLLNQSVRKVKGEVMQNGK